MPAPSTADFCSLPWLEPVGTRATLVDGLEIEEERLCHVLGLLRVAHEIDEVPGLDLECTVDRHGSPFDGRGHDVMRSVIVRALGL